MVFVFFLFILSLSFYLLITTLNFISLKLNNTIIFKYSLNQLIVYFLLNYAVFLMSVFFFNVLNLFIIIIIISLILQLFYWTNPSTFNLVKFILSITSFPIETTIEFIFPEHWSKLLNKKIKKIRQFSYLTVEFIDFFLSDLANLFYKLTARFKTKELVDYISSLNIKILKLSNSYSLLDINFYKNFILLLLDFNNNRKKKKSTKFSNKDVSSKLKVFYNKLISSDLNFKHFIIIYNFFKTTIVCLLVTLIYIFYTIFFFKIQFLKQIAVWFVIGILFFWLISGFNFFLKRYQYGKFTSQIQRFWKRTNTCFWLIEGFLLLLFFYYYLNSSQEPIFMYDYSSLNQEYLISLYTIVLNTFMLSLIIFFMYFILLRINSNSWEQLNIYLIVVSFFIFFSFFIETYQFYYVISVFNERVWLFNEEENLWVLDIENPILRTKTQYFLVCLIAKYWHFLFIFLSWVFFLLKSFEKKKVTFTLFSVNLQNIILLFVLNTACYAQWIKWLYRRFFDLPYSWFFINSDNKLFYNLFSEIYLILKNLISFNYNLYQIQLVVYKSLSIWSVDSLYIWKFI